MHVRRLLSPVILVVAFLASPASPVAAEETNQIAAGAPENQVSFTISARAALFPIKREGRFTNFAGELSYDPAHPSGTKVDVTVYTSSVDINNADQNAMLRSDQFFAVDRFPTMHFESIAAVPQRDGTLTVLGDLTIRGITKRIATPVIVRASGEKSVLETTFQIDRTDFGINGVPGFGGVSLSIAKKVQVHIAIATGQSGQSGSLMR